MEDLKENIKVVSITVKNQGMEAYALVTRGEGITITRDEIVKELDALHIKAGISEDAIERLLTGTEYGQMVRIACGQEAVPGQDGYFEYFFDRFVDTKPKTLEDGTIDYCTMTRIIAVNKGDKVIEYHPAVKGVDGFDIFGKVMKADQGKQLSPISGKGFILSEDKTIYTASLTGRIDYQNDRLIITDLLEIKEDIDYLHGDIYFNGDVMIHGNVMQGIMIKVEGKLTIRGHVEGATIVAGKDIVFESGMQGAGKGIVISNGNISGKFFEQVKMKAEGDITANAIMNCSMEAGGSIIVAGRRGIILGGVLKALKSITASTVGNISEIKTTLHVGLTDNIFVQVKNIEEKIEQGKQRIGQINTALVLIGEREEIGERVKFVNQKMQLLKSRSNTNKEINALAQEKEGLLLKFQQSRDAMIRVDKMIYPKTTICVNGVSKIITEELYRVSFTQEENEIETHNL